MAIASRYPDWRRRVSQTLVGRDMKLWPWLLGAVCLVFLVSSLEEIGVFMAGKGFKHAAKLLGAPSTGGNAPESEVETSGNPFGPRFRKDKDGRYQILPYKLKENDFDLRLVASKNTCATLSPPFGPVVARVCISLSFSRRSP